MASSPKGSAKPTVKRRAAAAARPKRAAKEESFLRFPLSDELRAKTLTVLAMIEHAPDPAKHGDGLADLVIQLTNAGMEFYFMRPLAAAKVGFLVQQSANLALGGSKQLMSSVIRSIIGRMDADQVLSVCDSIRALMR